MRSLRRIRELVRKEFRQVFRDSRLWRLIFFAPMFQLIVFGYAVSTDVRNVKTIVVDQDHSRLSRELVDSFTAPGYFRVVQRSDRPGDVAYSLDHGDAVAAVVIPVDFQSDIESGRGSSVQLLFDGTNSNIATIAKGYAERIVQTFAVSHGRILVNGVPSPSASAPPVALRDRAWFNPDLESRNYNVPAVVGAIIMLICLLLTSLAIVREREVGTLEQLMVSPLRPVELIIGKTIPFALIGITDLVVITTVAILWFGIPFRGSFFQLFVASVLYLLSALGIGLFISTISSTQQEAFMSSFLVFMPTILLSGFMFPVNSMPRIFQWMTLANPMRHYLEIVRATFLKGAGFENLLPQFGALTLIGATIILLAVRRFDKHVG